MIRSAIITVLLDKCIDILFDSIDGIVNSDPTQFRVGDVFDSLTYYMTGDSKCTMYDVKINEICNHAIYVSYRSYMLCYQSDCVNSVDACFRRHKRVEENNHKTRYPLFESYSVELTGNTVVVSVRLFDCDIRSNTQIYMSQIIRAV